MYFKVDDYLFLRDNMRYIKMQEPNLKNLLNQYPFTRSSLTLKATRGEHAIFFKCKNLFILIPPWMVSLSPKKIRLHMHFINVQNHQMSHFFVYVLFNFS